MPGLDAILDANTQYYLVVIGQAFSGFGGFSSSLISEVSDNWFDEASRVWITGMLSGSLGAGVIVCGLVTPHIVTNSDQLYLINILYFVPTIPLALTAILKVTPYPDGAILNLTLMMFFFNQIKSDKPPTAPSLVAETARKANHDSLREVASKLSTNCYFWMVALIIGLGFGLFTVVFTKSEQILCTLGYSTEWSGALISIFMATGIMGNFMVAGLLTWKSKPVLYLKLSMVFLSIVMGLFTFVQVLSSPIGKAYTIVLFVLLGLGVISFYPMLVMLISEITFPLPESIPLAITTVMSQLFSIFFLFLEGLVNSELRNDLDQVQVCWRFGDLHGLEPRDYLNFKLILFVATVTVTLVYCMFFNPVLARQQINLKSDSSTQLTSAEMAKSQNIES